MGCVYIPGSRFEELPKPPLKGVRLVFLDMQLENAGDVRQIGAHTAKVFGTVVAPNSGPMLLVLWTKHPTYVSAFKDALFEAVPAFQSGLVITSMAKPDTP